jgi:hypothetical protein
MSKRKRKSTGRPRKEGERHPCGKLKPEGPNPTVLAQRRKALGKPDATPAECKAAGDPLTLMLERGWIDAALYSAGTWYLSLHKAAGVPIPHVGVMDPNRSPGGVDHSDGDAGAHSILKRIWSRFAAHHGAASELSDVALHGVFPAWVLWWVENPPVIGDRARHEFGFSCKVTYHPDRDMPPPLVMQRATFLKALRSLREEQEAERASRLHPFNSAAVEPSEGVQATTLADTPADPAQRGPIREETVDYRDPDTGDPDPVLNRAGVPVEVVRRRRA